VRSLTGRLDLVHCNDSRDPHASHRDRHANIGAGKIPEELLATVVRDGNAPVVVETPGPEAAHKSDIEWVRRHAR
jgi:deoxyribonuclease-4